MKKSYQAPKTSTDRTQQTVLQPNKEINNNVLHAFANSNLKNIKHVNNNDFNTEKYINDKNNTSAFTNIKSMLLDEKRKFERFVPGVAVTEIIVGDGQGQVPLRKLQKQVKKLPKKLSKQQLREVRSRVKAIGGLQMPIPKGPMPMNRNAKMPKR